MLALYKMKKLKFLIMIILISIFTISLIPKEFQNDTFFTIAIGDKLLKNKDVNSLIIHDNVKFIHSGYFDNIIVNLYNKFDFLGIYIFVIVISVFQILLYNYILNKITKREILSFIFTLITVYFLSWEFTARAQIISFTLFLIEFYCIENIVRKCKKRYILTLIILPILIANLHSSVFPVYFVIYLPYIAEFILSKFNLKFNKDSKILIENGNLKILIILFVAGIFLGLCAPTGTSMYTDMFKAMKGISTNFIEELQPTNLLDTYYFSILIIITIAIISFTRTKVKLSDCLFILGFGMMTISTKRCIFFFYLISSICIFRIINSFLDEYNVKFNLPNKKIRLIIYCMFSIILLSFSIERFTVQANSDYVNSREYPVEASNWILDNLDITNMRLYNHFNFGSYLEFRGIKVFIDSRSGLYTPEFNKGCMVLVDYINMKEGNVSYKEIFEKYNITHAILYNEEFLNQYIVYDNEWELLYKDSTFSLYEKVNN